MRILENGGATRVTRRLLLAAAVLVAGTTASGCATLRATLHGYETGPGGIARPQHRLRQALVAGDFVQALAWHEDDALLDRLTRATSAYYAGQYLRAGALLDTAALESDDRITERLSRDALALVTNDNARPYRPRRTERLFIPYYGMLAYARAARWEDAAVEARRLAALLAQHESDRDAAERPLHAVLSHLVGAVLERAGCAGEAQVAYRVAHLMLEQAPERIATPGRDEGELLVVLERGFVAHRVTERIDVYIGDDDERRHDPRHPQSTDRPAAQSGADPRRPKSAINVLGEGGAASSDSGKVRRHRNKHHDDDADYWLAVAFPTLRRSDRQWGTGAQLRVEDVARDAVRIGSVVDDAASADERRDRLAMLARATARAGAKYAIAKAVKDKKGEVAGTLANYGASLLERADVRAWHLLPQEVQLYRTRMNAGTRAVRLEVTEGGVTRTLDLGTVTVRPGTLTIAPFRVWKEHAAPTTIAVR
jgi:hypothetical protein